MHMTLQILTLSILAVAAACDQPPPSAPTSDTASHAAAPTNRVDIPPTVRSNLGLTFATVERRQIESTLRLPGRFEYLPSARQEYTTPMSGRIELAVTQFEQVQPDTVLYRLDSPAWRDVQGRIAEAQALLAREEATLSSMGPLQAAHQRHEETLQQAADLWRSRLEQLEAIRQAGGGRAGDFAAARASLAAAEAELADVQERDAELEAQHVQAQTGVQAGRVKYDLLLESTAAMLRTSVDALVEPVQSELGSQPRWRTIDAIEIHAGRAGVVAHIDVTDGAWVEAHADVLEIVNPDQLRVHAVGLQSDLALLRDGLPVRVVPPSSTVTQPDRPDDPIMTGTLQLGLGGDADDRTVNVYVVPDALARWARPGVSAQLEVVTDPDASSELAVPLASVQQDGLERVIFRRNPKDPNTAIRIDADLGRDDGRWVEVLSGLRDGDEVVLDGAFQLMLATSATSDSRKGGHFHSDGTFHEGAH